MSDGSENLPPGWADATVGDVADYINGLAFSAKSWGDVGRPIIRIQNLTGSSDTFNYTQEEHPPGYVIPPGTILVSWSATLDAFIWNGPEGVLNQHIFKVVPHRDVVDERFLYWALKETIRDMREGAKLHGSTMKHINRGPFLAHRFPLPPLAEQRRITAKIDELQTRSRTAREALEAVPPLLEKFRQSVLAAALRGDLTAEWRDQNPDVEPASVLLERVRAERRQKWEEAELKKMRARGKVPKEDTWKQKYEEPEIPDTSTLPALPPEWVWLTLDTLLIADLANGRSVPTRENGFPVLRLTAVVDGRIDLSERKCGDWDRDQAVAFLVEEGDFLVTRGNGSLSLVGRGGLVGRIADEVAYPDTLIRVRANPSVLLPEFLRIVWDSENVRMQIEDLARTTAGIFKINQAHLRSIVIPLPPVREQRALISRLGQQLSRGERIREAVDASLQQTGLLGQSVLAKAFRGELVAQDPNDEPASVLLERIREERNAASAKETRRGARHQSAASEV